MIPPCRRILALPKMLRVRQPFRAPGWPTSRRSRGGPGRRRPAHQAGGHRGGGGGQPGIANIDVIVGATVDCSRPRGPAVHLPGDGQPRRGHRRGAALGPRALRDHRGDDGLRGPRLHGRGAGGRGPRAPGLDGPHRRRGRLDRAGQPDQAPHRLQGLDRVRPLQDDDDRARQVSGRHPVPPGQRQPRLRDGDHRGRARGAGQGPHRLRARHRRERLRRDGAGGGLRRRRPRGGRAAPPQGGARVDGAAALLAHRRARGGGDRQEHLRLGHGHQRDRAARPIPTSPSPPTRRSCGSPRSTSPRRATATPPASATPTSPRGGSSTRST